MVRVGTNAENEYSLTRIFLLEYSLLMLTTLTALAERNRLEIVELLRDGPRSVNEIAERLHLRQPQTSKHLHALDRAGIVVRNARAQQRIYSLRAGAFVELESWAKSFRRLWEDRLDSLENHLKSMKLERDSTEGR